MINVYVRKREPLKNQPDILKINRSQKIKIKHHYTDLFGKPKIQHKSYNFTRIFDENTSNQEIYETIIDDSKSLTCFMYGFTGSGKTFTILGKSKKEQGLLTIMVKKFLAMQPILVAYQIYNEQIYDLNQSRSKPLEFYENSKHSFVINGLNKIKITNENTYERILNKIRKNRQSSANQINHVSSRSHAIFELHVNNNVYRLVDLAGNEKSNQSNCHNLHDHMENRYINQSLFALKECIRNMHKDSKHVPFRRSKLTSILRDCFHSGHSNIMISTIMSTNQYYYDIINTLDYTMMMSNIKNSGTYTLPLDDVSDEVTKNVVNLPPIKVSRPKTANKSIMAKPNSCPCLPQLDFIKDYYHYLEKETLKRNMQIGAIKRYLDEPTPATLDIMFHTVVMVVDKNQINLRKFKEKSNAIIHNN